MALLDETSGIVFLVGFATGDVMWSVRVKQTIHGDKSQLIVVNATDTQGRVKTSTEWDELLARTGQAEDFWGEVVHEYLLIAGGGTLGRA
jgi:hypothetical protein